MDREPAQSPASQRHRVALGWRSCHCARMGSFPKMSCDQAELVKLRCDQGFQDREKELHSWAGKSHVASPNTTLGQVLECEYKLGNNMCKGLESEFSLLCLHSISATCWACSLARGTGTF